MHCIYCGHFKTHKRGKTKRGQGKYQRYFCSNCHKSFSELTGTIYQNRHLAPNDIDLVLTCERQGMSFNEVAKQLGVCPRTISNIVEICQGNSPTSINTINLVEAKLDTNGNENSITGNIVKIIVIRN
jgi:transposase-like protein